MAAANMSSFFRGSSPASTRRCTGTAPINLSGGPISGWRNSGALASTVIARGTAAMISIASIIAL